MILAHTLGAGGPEIELLMLGGALAVLGVVLFFQKTVKPMVPVLMLIGGVALGGGAFAFGGSPQATATTPTAPEGARIEILSPRDGASVPAGEQVDLELDVSGVALATNPQDTSGSHIHAYIDGSLVSMVYTNTAKLALPPGEHTVTVEVSDENHVSYSPPVSAQINVTAE